ncbi:hypothetical protein OIU84_002736 [Salix udensis]|uniref:Uncharacterized protein n=1 Tax=Salix udensis TaxID=889485 RepID=A0AAD6P5Q4_9ROSI|nr:hypothetical protein OIU84_002736 [Salix udensis]
MSTEEEVDDEECLGQVPDSSWAVPQIPSPPTASGLYWPKTAAAAVDHSFLSASSPSGRPRHAGSVSRSIFRLPAVKAAAMRIIMQQAIQEIHLRYSS